MVAQSLSAALRSARLDDERRDRLHAIERVLGVSRSLVADLDRARIVASIVDAVADLLAADLVGLFTRRVDGVYELEAGVGVRDGAIGSAAPPGSVLLERCVAERARVEGSLDGSLVADRRRPLGEPPKGAAPRRRWPSRSWWPTSRRPS